MMKDIPIQYAFQLPDAGRETFDLLLDGHSLHLKNEHPDNPPQWTRLAFHKCSNCPLDEDSYPHCPVAVNLLGIVKKFDNILSFEEVELEVTTRERTISQTTTAQRAIASFMGLVIATCGCPHTFFLKPMARFHLPLASEEETIYRAFSMHALAQYFMDQEKGANPGFEHLKNCYDNLQKVNVSIADRLKAASDSDSSVNALINLDMYAKAMPYVIEESLEELRYLFEPYRQSKIP